MVDNLKKQCKGLWPSIIGALCPALTHAVKNRPQHVPCPTHGGTDGLRCFNDFDESGGMICNTCGALPDGIAVLQWANGWTFPESISAIEKCLKDIEKNGITPVEFQDSEKISYLERFKRQKVLEKVIAELVPLDTEIAQPARRYLRHRGLDPAFLLPCNLLFHPCMEYWENGDCYEFPALVAKIETIDGTLATLHRTYITKDGQKAPVSSPKKMMKVPIHGVSTGAAIRLYPANGHVAIAEGIETALAIHQATSLPVWATVSAQGMINLDIPETVEDISIWCDLDLSKTGEVAAAKLTNRLIDESKKKVTIHRPPIPIPEGKKSVDWLDVLNCEGSLS